MITGYGEIPADAGSLFVDVITKPVDGKFMRRVLERVLTDVDER